MTLFPCSEHVPGTRGASGDLCTCSRLYRRNKEQGNKLAHAARQEAPCSHHPEANGTRPTFEAFTALVEARLEAGAREYGDRSFSRDPAELLREIDEELLDVCGWAYVLHCRIAAMRVAVEESGR